MNLHANYLWFIIASSGHGNANAIQRTTCYLCVNEDLYGWDPHYAVRAMVNGDLLILNWSPTESVARGADRNGNAVAMNTWQQMVFEAGLSFKWVRYTTGTPVPKGAVVGGHLADGTPLYVAIPLGLSSRRLIGYYDPAIGKASSYWTLAVRQGGIINIMVNASTSPNVLLEVDGKPCLSYHKRFETNTVWVLAGGMGWWL